MLMSILRYSGRLLQPDQPNLWLDHGVLLSPELSRDESNRRVQIFSPNELTYNQLTGCRFEYLWQDTEQYKKPTKMAAPEYIEHLMTWVQSNIDNEAMFPSRIGVAFPRTFRPLILQIFKRLYRVYAHIYCHHYPVIINLGLEPHLNTSFKHYVLFVEEHNLAQGSRDYWGPLGDLVESMLRSE
jgi:hypothetical protein